VQTVVRATDGIQQHTPRSGSTMNENVNKIPPAAKHEKERGKVGLAILMWMLGVPGFIIALYVIFG
jgi:hypothetical protein